MAADAGAVVLGEGSVRWSQSSSFRSLGGEIALDGDRLVVTLPA